MKIAAVAASPRDSKIFLGALVFDESDVAAVRWVGRYIDQLAQGRTSHEQLDILGRVGRVPRNFYDIR
jgi:hypothetical protein